MRIWKEMVVASLKAAVILGTHRQTELRKVFVQTVGMAARLEPFTTKSAGTLYHQIGWNPVSQNRLEPCATKSAGTLYHQIGWNPAPPYRMEPCTTKLAGTLHHQIGWNPAPPNTRLTFGLQGSDVTYTSQKA